MPNKKNINTGNAGEYFVAGELSRRDFIVAVPMSNVESFDILAIHNRTHKQYAIQVKTTVYNKNEWTLNRKNENLVGDNIFYVFVTLSGLSTPSYYIVPSKVVANFVKKNHKLWLKKPGKMGNKHNDNNIRKFKDSENLYLNRWDFFK